MARDLSNRDETLSDWIKKRSEGVRSLDELSAAISDLANHAGKKLVLLIDEVDKSSNNQLFVSFLGMLRNKYLRRHLKTDATFHAVVLAGVHDVKSPEAENTPRAGRPIQQPVEHRRRFQSGHEPAGGRNCAHAGGIFRRQGGENGCFRHC